MSIRLAIIVSHPIQHFAPWHRELSNVPGLHAKVFFCCDWGCNQYHDPGFNTQVQWDIPLLDGYEHEFLRIKRRPHRLNFWSVDNPDVASALTAFQPDVVQVFGYGHRTNWRAAAWARRNHRPVLLYSDSNAKHVTSWWKRLMKEPIVQRFYNRMDAALFVGDNNRDYHLRYGLPSERLFPGVLPIQLDRLAAALSNRDSDRNALRLKLNIPPDAFLVLWCGKYISRKRPQDLVQAVESLGRRGVPIWGLLVGDGELRTAVTKYCVENAIRNVAFAGFVNQSEVARYYSVADALAVTSSRDPHPLVVSEACALGLPIVVSDVVGCVGRRDTAQPERNALVYACGDVKGLADAIERLYLNPESCRRMSSESFRIAKAQDVSAAAEQLSHAVHSLHKLGPRSDGSALARAPAAA